ncbi:MAG: PD-(D/E)XK nuclease superfamily protein [Patescibacteria group bacterium]
MVLPALKRGGYKVSTQVNIGNRISGGKHIIDAIAKDANEGVYLISLKWQQVGGTAEQKVPFEVMCLADSILKSKAKHKKAYLILGGEGWTLRNFFVNGGLNKHLKYGNLVQIFTLESFIAKANKGAL